MIAIRTAFAAIAQIKMSAPARLVYLALADFHNQDTGRCDPSVNSIRQKTQLSERSVRNALRELESLRQIETVFRMAKTGRGKKNLTSRYRVIGGAPTAAPMGQDMPPNHNNTRPSAFDDLAMSIEVPEGD